MFFLRKVTSALYGRKNFTINHLQNIKYGKRK
ncbi:hypothetical protein T11_14891 [Trichinella zimbabwensis]|uniref:Uncharacterized protein n=1 Tax=Trichinella zimbabwensis TaxID=268475 RepID=A0A0V1GEH9_9BILA|nr:hypothetical protein T11_14891 [Trichinella zimbabwensis]